MRHDAVEFPDTVPEGGAAPLLPPPPPPPPRAPGPSAPLRRRPSTVDLRPAMLAGATLTLVAIVAVLLAGPRKGIEAEPATVAAPKLGAYRVAQASRSTPPRPSPSSAAAASAASPLVPLPPGQVDVCGAGPMPADAAGFPELTPAWAERADQAAASLASSLAAAADARMRAAGLLLQQMRATQAAHASATDSDVGADPIAAALKAGAPSAGALATLAASSNDPAVHAAALRACQPIGISTQPRADACQLVSMAQWAHIDPGNAVPWLHIAAAAAERRDRPGLDEAMHRVATATASRTYGDVLTGVAIEQTSDAADFEQTQMAQSGVGIAGGWPLPAYHTVTRYCEATALRDSNRMQTCDAIAHNFIGHPSSVIEWRIGLRLGERLGWPAPQLSALQERRDAYAKAYQLVYPGFGFDGCAANAKARAFWLETARRGEVAALDAVFAAASSPYSSARPPAR